MAQKLNKKLVGFLIVSIMVLMGVTAVILIENLPEQDPSKYAADGEKFMAQGDYEKAGQAFHRAYLKDKAKNPDYLVKSAQCALETGEIHKARSLLQYAKVQDATHKGALQLDLDLEFEIAPYLEKQINAWKDVAERAQTMLGMDAFAGSARVHYILGCAYLKLRGEDTANEAKGEEQLKRALELDPSNVEAVTVLVEYLSSRAMEHEAGREMEEARALRAARLAHINSAIEKCAGPDADARRFQLRILQARCQIVDGETESGLEALRALAAEETEKVDARLMLGRMLTFSPKRLKVTQNLEEAEKVLKSALASSPKTAGVYRSLGDVYQLQAAQSEDSAYKESRMQALRSLYRSGLENIEHSKHFRKMGDTRARIKFYESLLLQDLASARAAKDAGEKERRLSEAESWIEKMKGEFPPEWPVVRLCTAHLYYARGDLISATREAEAAAAMPSEEYGAAQRLCAELYMQQRQWGAARDVLAKMLSQTSSDPSLLLSMAHVLMNLDQPTEALQLLKSQTGEIRAALENDQDALRLQVEAYRRLKQFDQATAISQRIDQGRPEDEQREAVILVSEGKYAEAEEKLKRILERDPSNETAVWGMVQVYINSNRRKEGQAFIEGLLDRFPHNRKFKQFAVALLENSSEEEREREFLKLIESESDPYIRHLSYANFYEQRGQIEKAIAAADQAEQAKPDDPTVIEIQFGLAIRKNDWDRAAQYARKSADLNIDGTQGKMAQGRLALARGAVARQNNQLDEARTLTQQAIDLMKVGLDNYPVYSQGWTFLATAYIEAGRMDDARTTLQRALQINPLNGQAALLLARLAMADGDESLERRYLADAARTMSDNPFLRERQQYYKEKDDPAASIPYRESIAKEKPDDVMNLVRLAQLYADPKVAAYDKAADAYRKALAASNNDLGLATEVARFFGSDAVGHPAEGEKVLKNLIDQEEDKTKKAHATAALARFHETQNELATAERLYRQAIFHDSTLGVVGYLAEFYMRTGNLVKAAEQYETMLPMAAGDTDVTRQLKARLISIRLNLNDLERARAMIEEYLVQYPDDPEGLILEGAMHRLGGDVDKAKAALDAHLQRDPDNAVALFQRGQLYLLLGRWELAIEDLKRAKAFQPDGFQYRHRVALANALIEAGRADEGISELQLILEANPDDSTLAATLITAYMRVRPARVADAENLIYRYQSRFPRDPLWPTRLGLLGQEAGDWDKAISGYEKAAELGNYQPAAVRQLFLAYRNAQRPEKIIQFATEKLSSRVLDRIPEALSSLAWAYAKAGMRDKCYEAFDRALRATERNFVAYTQIIGDIVMTLGREEALRRAQEQSDAEPENVAKLQALLHMLKINDRDTEALKICDRIREIATGDTDLIIARLAKGMLLSSAKKFVEARKEYEEVLKLDPQNVSTLNNLAYLLAERLDAPAEALPYARKVAQLQPKDPQILDTLGWTLFLNGQYGEAAGTLLRAMEVDRDFDDTQKSADVRYHLGKLYIEQGKPEDAQAMLETAQRLCKAQGRTDELPKNIEEALQQVRKGN